MCNPEQCEILTPADLALGLGLKILRIKKNLFSYLSKACEGAWPSLCAFATRVCALVLHQALHV